MTYSYIGLTIATILVWLACYIVARTVMTDQVNLEDREGFGNPDKKEFKSPIFKLLYPFIKKIVPSVVKWKLEKFRREYKIKLSNAGLRDFITVDELYAFKVVLSIVMPCVIYIYNALADLGLSVSYSPFLALFGWFYPKLWIDGVIKSRKERIKRELPFIIDLLCLSMEAGLDFNGALQKVVEKSKKGPLRDEFETVLKETKLGVMRSQALRNMAERIDIKEISSLVAIVVSAERMGTPIGDVLRSQSDMIRHERSMEAEKRGAQAATKVLLPLIIFILPAVFVVIFGPIILKQIYGGQ